MLAGIDSDLLSTRFAWQPEASRVLRETHVNHTAAEIMEYFTEDVLTIGEMVLSAASQLSTSSVRHCNRAEVWRIGQGDDTISVKRIMVNRYRTRMGELRRCVIWAGIARTPV